MTTKAKKLAKILGNIIVICFFVAGIGCAAWLTAVFVGKAINHIWPETEVTCNE